MFRQPVWAADSHGSGPLAARTVGTKSTGQEVVTLENCHPVFLPHQDIYEILDKEVRRHVAKGGAALGWEAA